MSRAFSWFLISEAQYIGVYLKVSYLISCSLTPKALTSFLTASMSPCCTQSMMLFIYYLEGGITFTLLIDGVF